MAVILPSLASANTADLKGEISRLGGYPYLHFDIEDGNFVDNITFGLKTISAVRKLSDADFDAHLMVTDPLKYIKPLAELCFQSVSFHWESTMYPMRIIHEIKKYGMKAGIALNPATPAEAVSEYLSAVDRILVMASEPDGAGELFQKRVLEKICRIRKLNGRIHILVDGGVDPEIMEIAVEAGADMIVMGRAVFGSPDPEAFLREHNCG